jgi:hypothetical protein
MQFLDHRQALAGWKRAPLNRARPHQGEKINRSLDEINRDSTACDGGAATTTCNIANHRLNDSAVFERRRLMSSAQSDWIFQSLLHFRGSLTAEWHFPSDTRMSGAVACNFQESKAKLGNWKSVLLLLPVHDSCYLLVASMF